MQREELEKEALARASVSGPSNFFSNESQDGAEGYGTGRFRPYVDELQARDWGYRAGPGESTAWMRHSL